MSSTEILATALGVVVLGPLLLVTTVRSITKPQLAMAVGLVTSLLSLSSLGVPELRYALVLAFIPHIGTAIKNTNRGTHCYYPSFKVLLLYVLICFISIIWSLNPFESFISSAAWLILLLFVYTFRTLLTPESIRRIVFFVLLGFFIVSLIFLVSPEGWAGGRARGIFNNANAAGIYTFLLLGVSLFMGRRYWLWLFPVGLVFIFATGSRAALLSVLVVISISVFSSVNNRLRIPIVVLLFSSMLYPIRWFWNWLQQLDVEGDSILRTNDSRASTWEVAFSFIRENPYLGAGYGATPPLIGSSSYIKLVAEFGFVFAVFGILVACSYIQWSRHEPIMLGLTLGVLLNTFFEDWLLTAGAPMLAVYLLLVMSTPQQHSPKSPGRDVRDLAAEPLLKSKAMEGSSHE